MSKQFLLVALCTLVLGLAGAVRADEAAKAPTPPGGECPHMKAMREAQEQGKGGECPHSKDGKPCDCPNHKAAGAPNSDKPNKPGKQPAKADKVGSKKGAKAPSATEAKGSKD
jgi:hypothetical protein